MLVDNLHMRDPGVESGEMVLYGPGGTGVRSRILGPELGNGHLRAFLRVREQFYGEIKRSQCESKPDVKESL
jgi:hypothetical protein